MRQAAADGRLIRSRHQKKLDHNHVQAAVVPHASGKSVRRTILKARRGRWDAWAKFEAAAQAALQEAHDARQGT